MKSFPYIWRMALRRKGACLLVVLSTMAAAVFMLFYPSLIETVRTELEGTYDGIAVTGSILTAGVDSAPAVSDSLWRELQSSGYFSELYATLVSAPSRRAFWRRKRERARQSRTG